MSNSPFNTTTSGSMILPRRKEFVVEDLRKELYEAKERIRRLTEERDELSSRVIEAEAARDRAEARRAEWEYQYHYLDDLYKEQQEGA